MNGDPHGALILQSVRGDRDALSELLRRTGPAVRSTIARRIPGRFRRVLSEDDVMQVTYLEAFLRIRSFDAASGSEETFVAWLTRIAENNLVDAVRWLRRKKRPDHAGQAPPPARDDSCRNLVELLTAGNTSPSRGAARNELPGLIARALDELPADYRSVIQQYDLDGETIETVARQLGRSVGATYMLRARAHDRLREALGSGSKFFSGES